MAVRRVHRWGIGAGLAGGSAAVAAVLGMGVAHADGGTDEINGWTVTPTDSSIVGGLIPGATLSDPGDSLGLGTSISGGWDSVTAAPLSNIGSNDFFTTGLSAVGTPDYLNIQNNWLFGTDVASVQTGVDNNVFALLIPADHGNQVVDLYSFGSSDAPPLFNPDATGPIDIGGVQLADPQDGALLNDLSDAIFKGDTADWTNATTLIDDLFGIDPSAAADAVDVGGWLPDLGL